MTETEKCQSRHWYAKIQPYVGRRKVRHTVGLPPELSEFNDSGEQPVEMPWPHVVVLAEDQTTGQATLLRLTRDGELAGDTWHESLELAKQQTEFEYGSTLGTWNAVPEDVEDAEAYALARVQKQADRN